MLPRDIRDYTWDQIRDLVRGDRKIVHAALLNHGPITTRELATAMGWDILRVRPRVTELVQLGLAKLHGSVGREGIYCALGWPEARLSWEALRGSVQMEMGL